MAEKRFWLYDYLAILIGAVLTALALDLFLVPNKIAAGGVSGLATVVFHLFRFKVGLVMLVINIPLFLLSLKMLGPTFLARTLFGLVALSFATDLLSFLRPLTQDALLAALYGGVLSGLGIGITLKWGGSTGGTDLAAMILHRWLKTSVGQALLFIDFVIIVLAGVVFQSAELAMYAMIALFITSYGIDLVQEGMPYAKTAYIISDRAEEIAHAVLHQMGRGVTALRGRGVYTGTDRNVLFIIVARGEIAQLKELVRGIDPRAFVVISEAHEVLGEGFKAM
ncbi:MAG: YitT family protein [Bacillota bacterium]|nr:YitT family protein [Bacillota bacterium]